MLALMCALVAWWAIMPWLALWIGWRAGHPVLGWVLGLMPVLGFAIAWMAWPPTDPAARR